MQDELYNLPRAVMPFRLAVPARRISFIGRFLSKIFPGVKYDLIKADVNLDGDEYLSLAAMNSALLSSISFILIFILMTAVRGMAMEGSILRSALLASAVFLLISSVIIKYPSILAGKKAELVDKNLLFALRDMYLQVSSGVTMYDVMVNIAQSGYGVVSQEFKEAAQRVSSGESLKDSLETIAKTTKSQYMRKAAWQIVNTLKAGASIKGTLKTIIDDLALDQKSKILGYTKELNLWSLLYMSFAVAVPTIGMTMMIVLSSFSGVGVTPEIFILFLAIVFLLQYVIIGIVKARRPSFNF